MYHPRSSEVAVRLLRALGFDPDSQPIQRLTLVIACDDMPRLYVELAGDQRLTGDEFLSHAAELHPDVIIGPPPPREG
jgi:hypothetical protein